MSIHTAFAANRPTGLDFLARGALEIFESVLLASLEPAPLVDCYEDDFRRALAAIGRGLRARSARFRVPVTRNAFLLACGDCTDGDRKEHLIVGYGRRHGSTTRVTALHHVLGDEHAVSVPHEIAHAMHTHFNSHPRNELLVFHNHPPHFLHFLLDNFPLASAADRRQLEQRALSQEQLLRALQGDGRVLFYLGENGAVKQFCLPRLLTRIQLPNLARQPGRY